MPNIKLSKKFLKEVLLKVFESFIKSFMLNVLYLKTIFIGVVHILHTQSFPNSLLLCTITWQPPTAYPSNINVLCYFILA